MSYQHPKLGMAIHQHFGGTPPGGISTANGELSAWPDGLSWPSDTDLAQWVTDYEAYLLSNQCKDDDLMRFLDTNGGKAVKAMALLLIEKGVCTLNELKAKYRSL